MKNVPVLSVPFTSRMPSLSSTPATDGMPDFLMRNWPCVVRLTRIVVSTLTDESSEMSPHPTSPKISPLNRQKPLTTPPSTRAFLTATSLRSWPISWEVSQSMALVTLSSSPWPASFATFVMTTRIGFVPSCLIMVKSRIVLTAPSTVLVVEVRVLPCPTSWIEPLNWPGPG